MLVLWYLAWMVNWGNAQLWFDEVITLNNYCGAFSRDCTFGSVFRNYTLANNHILSSAIYWLWIRLCTPQARELLLRLPSIAFGVATLCVLYFGWRRYIGRVIALLCVAMFASSPVFLPFAYQIRGYSLAMMLSALTMLPLMAILRGDASLRHQLALAVLLVLQPLIMPSGVILAGACAAAIFFTQPRRWQDALPAVLGGALGLAYYLTLWTQFKAAAIDAGSISLDWWTRWSSARHVVFAFTLHLMVALLILAVMLCRRKFQLKQLRMPCAILCGAAAVWLAMYVLAGSKTVPFPRNSLVLLPMLSFGVMLLLRQCGFRLKQPLHCGALGGVIMLFGAAVIMQSMRYEQARVRQGDIPQNLLVQQYRGDCSIRDFVDNLQQAGIDGNCLIVVSDNDGAVAKWYFKTHHFPAQNIFDRTDALQSNPRVINRNIQNLPVFIGARLRPEAEQLAKIAGYDGVSNALMTTSHRQFYRAIRQ